MKSLAIAFVLTIVGVNGPAEAGHYGAAPHWPDGAKVLVWIDSNLAPPGATALVHKAMDAWTTAAGGRLTLAPAAKRDDAAIRVFFVRSDRVFGEAAPRVDQTTGLFTGAEIALNAGIPGATGDPSDIDARIVVYLTALHELGHALGLPHSDRFSSIMYRFRRPDDGERFFGAYRSNLRSVDDIGTNRAFGLDREDISSLKMLYVIR